MDIIFSTEEYGHFCTALEKQTLRSLRRFHDYGKRLESGQGLEELYQLIGKILLDDGNIYGLEDKALAFEVAVCEHMASCWHREVELGDELAFIIGPLNKARLYRQLLSLNTSPSRRGALIEILSQKYKKQLDWIRSSVLLRADKEKAIPNLDERWFKAFLATLDACEPMLIDEATEQELLKKKNAELFAELEEKKADLQELDKDLVFAEDRSVRAHRRLRQEEQEGAQLKKQLRQERENGEQLRQERSRRIKLGRQATEVQKELDQIRLEYAKMDKRLQQMAQRLVAAEQQCDLERQQSVHRVDLERLRNLSAEKILGVTSNQEHATIGDTRRRFAAVFHSDRVNQLPLWVQVLFDEILSVVNEACDRLKK